MKTLFVGYRVTDLDRSLDFYTTLATSSWAGVSTTSRSRWTHWPPPLVCELRPADLDERSNAAIAQHLVISGKTVSNHISAIFAELQVADRAEAIIRARQAGLGLNT